MSYEEMSLGLRALPTAEVRGRRGRATALAADRDRPILDRLGAVLAGAFIDDTIDGHGADPLEEALKILRAERDDLTRMINMMENSR